MNIDFIVIEEDEHGEEHIGYTEAVDAPEVKVDSKGGLGGGDLIEEKSQANVDVEHCA